MTIHKVYAHIFKIWRARRMKKFEELLKPLESEVLIDVGGYPSTWIKRPQLTKQIDCINTHKVDWSNSSAPGYRISTSVGNGCALECPDKSYDIVFSNSVIEHVGDWNNQCAFAKEVRRVGKKLWLQTPAFECPVEPHYLTLFIHWFPEQVQRQLLRWFSLWGWISKPNQEKINQVVTSTRLLTRKQVQSLFPDCELVTERLLWIFPKSYIVYRIEE